MPRLEILFRPDRCPIRNWAETAMLSGSAVSYHIIVVANELP